MPWKDERRVSMGENEDVVGSRSCAFASNGSIAPVKALEVFASKLSLENESRGFFERDAKLRLEGLKFP